VTKEAMESALAVLDELDQVMTQVELEDYLSMASQTMEIYEMFDKASAVGSDYGKGYQDGFWAGRKLDAKYQLAKMESIKEKISIL
jgi:hypothetical protein